MSKKNIFGDVYPAYPHQVKIDDDDRADEAEQWLQDNLQRKRFTFEDVGKWARHFKKHNLFVFKSDDDAMLFKLTWGGT